MPDIKKPSKHDKPRVGRTANLPKRGPGRPKGTPNKITADIRAMIEGALQDAGGREYLARQAIANPPAFMVLVGKILPNAVAVSGEITIELVKFADQTPE
jgi:hypothetical protein